MKRDPHTVYEAALATLTDHTCFDCGNSIGDVKILNVSARLSLHTSDCPLRIVIEAALENTEAKEKLNDA